MSMYCRSSWRRLNYVICNLILALFIFGNVSAQTPEEKGEKLFKQNCSSCHALNKKVVGPALSGVLDRVPQPAEAWLIKWIKNSTSMIKGGDSYAVKIFNENNKSVMPNQAVSDDEIKSILAYIKNPPVDKTIQVDPKTSNQGAGEDAGASSNYYMYILAILFVVLIVVFSGMRKNLEKIAREKSGLPQLEPKPFAGEYSLAALWYWMRTHKKWVAVITLVLVGYFSQWAWYTMKDIGVYTNYKPEQPIAFSHKIHAGQNGINCQYCHSGVEKSKVANVPSANVCMNCHKYIQEGAITGKKEIAKIYAALGYDPDKQTYSGVTSPIKWVRVHNLPDHVYFNHSQHVKVGKIECTECHGEIAKMDTVRQHSPLTMGWCIECHRKTEVKMEGNAYYDELHAKLKAKYKGEPITVSKMGGLECGKCHY